MTVVCRPLRRSSSTISRMKSRGRTGASVVMYSVYPGRSEGSGNAECKMQNAECRMQNAECKMSYNICFCILHFAFCISLLPRRCSITKTQQPPAGDDEEVVVLPVGDLRRIVGAAEGAEDVGDEIGVADDHHRATGVVLLDVADEIPRIRVRRLQASRLDL